jgi:putative membrane protein
VTGWTNLLVVAIDLAAMTYATGVLRMWGHARVGEGIGPRQVISFVAGISALFVALVSPLSAASGSFLSDARVHQELLVLLAGPLLVHGRPMVAFRWAVCRPGSGLYS